MPQVVGKRQGFAEILVKAQATADGPGDLRDLQGMGQAGLKNRPRD